MTLAVQNVAGNLLRTCGSGMTRSFGAADVGDGLGPVAARAFYPMGARRGSGMIRA